MQKVELTDKQYRALLQLVALGVDVLENAVVDQEKDESEGSEALTLLDEALELEDYLMQYFKKFGGKDIIEECVDEGEEEEYLDYTGSFREANLQITTAAYFNKTTEIASFQLGLRDFREARGLESNEDIADSGALSEEILPFTTKYLNEIIENGFDRMFIKDGQSARIINLSSE